MSFTIQYSWAVKQGFLIFIFEIRRTTDLVIRFDHECVRAKGILVSQPLEISFVNCHPRHSGFFFFFLVELQKFNHDTVQPYYRTGLRVANNSCWLPLLFVFSDTSITNFDWRFEIER